MIKLIDKYGHVVAEVSEEVFPLMMPLTLRHGEREYFLKIFYEEDGKTPRSALLNTTK